MHAHIYTVTPIMANSDLNWPILINFGPSVLQLFRGIFLGGNSSKELATFTQVGKAKGDSLVLTNHIIHGTEHE